MNNNTINSILKYLIFTGLFLIPFVFLIAPSDPSLKNPNAIIFFANNFFFPFITSKAFVFRIIVEVIFALWLVLMLRDKKYLPKFSWISVTLTVFAVVALIADLFGVNPLRSLWSNFERMEGWVTIVHMWAYFMVLSSVFIEKKQWKQFLNVNLFVALMISIYGIFQLTGHAEIHQGSVRLDASLGNAIYLAVYMLFNVFFSLYMAYEAWIKKQRVLSCIYSILALLFAFIVFETETRGTILGLLGGIMVALFILFVFERANKAIRISSGIILGLIILSGLLFYFNRNASFIQKNQTLQRLASISWEDTKTQARGFIWPMAVKGAFQSPKTAIIGWGQENFNYIFNANYNPKMWNQEAWFDRAHNVYLDWLVNAGLLGLVLYLGLFVTALLAVWKSEMSLIEKSIFIGLLVSYGIHNIFVFDNLASYVLFATTLAFIHVVKADKPYVWLEKTVNLTSENFVVVRDYAVLPVVIILFGITLYCVNITPIEANSRLIYALAACGSGKTASTDYFKSALAMDKYMANQEIREQLLSCSSQILNNDQFSPEDKQNFLQLTSDAIKQQVAVTPNDARIYTLGATFYNSIGAIDQALPLITKAHQLSPQKQQISIQLAVDYLNSGKFDDAVSLLKTTYDSDPTDTDVQSPYILALIADGKIDVAHQIFGNDPALFENEQVAEAYVSLKQYSKAIDIFETLLKASPTDVSLAEKLAQTQYAAGLKSDAISTLRNVLEKNHPEMKAQIEAAIAQVQSAK